MFKILIADDQKYIRTGIADYIDWGSIDCEVVGLAANGEEALDIVKAEQPNVVITDIMMPIMSGLELVDEIKKNYPDIYIIIISAYDEFDYVQQALKLGVDDYVLKPVDVDYLKEYIVKFYVDYKFKVEQVAEHSALVNRVNESQSVVKSQILEDLIYERISPEDAETLMKDYGIDMDQKYHSILIGQVDDYTIKENGDIRREKYNTFLSVLTKRVETRPNLSFLDKRAGELILCISGIDRGGLNESIMTVCDLLQEDVGSYMDDTITIAVGLKSEGYDGLADSYKKAIELLDYKYVLGNNQIIYDSSVKRLKKENKVNLLRDFDEKELLSSIKFSDKEMIREGLKALAEKIRDRGKESYIYTNLIVASIYRHALEELEETGGKIEDVFEEPLGIYTSIINQETINGMVSELDKALLAISNHISSLLLGKSAQIEKAKDYIADHYSDSDMSLESVAKYVNMSVSYFGNVFKQEVQVNFVDYLTGIRIDKAKELLKKSFKSYEVSDLVGYNNPTYFSTVFKRVTGVTPSKYS